VLLGAAIAVAARFLPREEPAAITPLPVLEPERIAA
jgi:hypothetical protein